MLSKQYLASGTFGMVYKVLINNSPACQKMFLETDNKYGTCQDILREIFHFSSPYSKLAIYDIAPSFKCITVDLYDGDLYLNKKNKGLLLDTDLMAIRSQLLEQLYLIHSHGFIHSDVKIANVLFKQNEYALCDFGLCEFYGFPGVRKPYICTEYFKAPENSIKNNINFDIYSLGATLHYLNELKFNEIIDIQSISNPVIIELLNSDHSISAKKMMRKENQTLPLKDEYVSRLKAALDLNTMTAQNQNTDINDSIFLNLSIKNDRYHSYNFGQPRLYELEYLDDMFTKYSENRVVFNQYNNMEKKLSVLKGHRNINTHLETLFFAWYLIDTVPQMGLIDPIIESILYFNYSCKILEFNSLYKVTVQLNYLNNIEFNISSYIMSKKIAFTPAVFYLYYFLYAISTEFPSQYYLEYRILEGIALPLLLLYFIRPVSFSSELTYLKLSFEIVMCAIDFVRLKKIRNIEFEAIIRTTVKYVPPNVFNYVIENNELNEYLRRNV